MKKLSKLMSLVLRHKPEAIGIELDEFGWTDVDKLIVGLKNNGMVVNSLDVEEVVRYDSKRRYSYNEHKTKIRANQGHSIEVDLELKEHFPPEYLVHGTPEKFADIIKKEGLKKMNRHHVHLSKDVETAKQVAERRGKAVIFVVKAKIMERDGHKFYKSENGVWLTDHVPAKYLEVLK